MYPYEEFCWQIRLRMELTQLSPAEEDRQHTRLQTPVIIKVWNNVYLIYYEKLEIPTQQLDFNLRTPRSKTQALQIRLKIMHM